MRLNRPQWLLAALTASAVLLASLAWAEEPGPGEGRDRLRGRTNGEDGKRPLNGQVGPRPYYLVDALEDGPLKRKLESCAEMEFRSTKFSIGHRGAPLQFPEHTKESYLAAARMGAGLIECDVTFTKDGELVCRHAQCDLHTSTNILASDLAHTCVEPFTPAHIDPDGGERIQASARCCTSDITLAQFKSLCGKMDGSNPDATSVDAYMRGTAKFRTDLYSSCGTLLSHRESIALIDELGADFVPELKSPEIAMPFDSDGDGVGDYSREDYAQQMIDEYRAAGIGPGRVWSQSGDLADLRYWLGAEPSFGEQAVFLDSRPYEEPGFEPSLADFERLAETGVKIVAPPLFALVELDASDTIVPSRYAKLARGAGLEVIAWSFERSGRLVEDVMGVGATGVKQEGAGGTFFYQTTLDGIRGDGQVMETLHVLASEVGVIGVFSDWPGTVTYYANCMGLDPGKP